MASANWQLETPACSDGLDNDGDGTADYPDDPGCASTVDESENAASVACDDRVDDDGDGLIDFPRDPGCRDSAWSLEDPQCQDGVNNDGAVGTDFDGGPTPPRGIEDISDLALITDAMLRRGYSEQRIRKFLGLNLLRVFRTVTQSPR